MVSQEALLGSSVHDAARRAADIIDVLVPRQADPHPPDDRARLTAVLRAYGETGPIGISPADLTQLRQAALDLREVFAAGDWRWPCCWPSARHPRPGCARRIPAASRS